MLSIFLSSTSFFLMYSFRFLSFNGFTTSISNHALVSNMSFTCHTIYCLNSFLLNSPSPPNILKINDSIYPTIPCTQCFHTSCLRASEYDSFFCSISFFFLLDCCLGYFCDKTCSQREFIADFGWFDGCFGLRSWLAVNKRKYGRWIRRFRSFHQFRCDL
eukprot:430744_1